MRGGEVIINGGSISINSHGSSFSELNSEAVIFAGNDGNKTITMKNVELIRGTDTKYICAYGGNTTLYTTDTLSEGDTDIRNGAQIETIS